MKDIITNLYHNRALESLLHTVVHELKNELADCESVLDLGCGPDSPIKYCQNIKRKVGIEAYQPYLLQSQKKNIHHEYIGKKIEDLDFQQNSFDAVVMVEVLEHLTKEKGRSTLEKVEKWAKKKVVITTPNGYIRQRSLDENQLQKHLSGWTPEEFVKRGYKVKGLAGPKFLRKEAEHESMNDSLVSTIRWEPKMFWFAVSSLSQALIYYLPEMAFEFIAVKDLRK